MTKLEGTIIGARREETDAQISETFHAVHKFVQFGLCFLVLGKCILQNR